VQSDQTIQVDTLVPTLDLTVTGTTGTGNWYNSGVSVSASANDSGSGVASIETSLNGGAYAPYAAPLSLGDGVHSYQFRATDIAGNSIESLVGGLSVDTTPPDISMPESWELGHIARFELQDDGSGLAHLRVVFVEEADRYPKVFWQEGLSGTKFQGEIDWNGRFKGGILAPPGGEYYAKVKVVDNAGNESIQYGQIIIPVEDSSSGVAVFPQAAGSVAEESPITIAPAADPEPAAAPAPAGNTNEQIIPVTGGKSAQPTSAQVGTTSFSIGGRSNTPAATNSQSNPSTSSGQVLWGATATATIGAFAADIARRKREKAARRQRAIARHEKKMKALGLAKPEKLTYKQRAKAYQASLNAFKDTLIVNGVSVAEAIKQRTEALRNGKIPSATTVVANFRAKQVEGKTKRARILTPDDMPPVTPQKSQSLRDRILTFKEKFLDPIIPKPKPKPVYVPADMSWKQADMEAANIIAQEIANATFSTVHYH